MFKVSEGKPSFTLSVVHSPGRKKKRESSVQTVAEQRRAGGHGSGWIQAASPMAAPLRLSPAPLFRPALPARAASTHWFLP